MTRKTIEFRKVCDREFRYVAHTAASGVDQTEEGLLDSARDLPNYSFFRKRSGLIQHDE